MEDKGLTKKGTPRIRAPGAGPKRKSKARLDASRSLAMLDPVAVRVIDESIEGIEKDKEKIETAKWVYEQNHGKAKASTDLRVKGQIDFTSEHIRLAQEYLREIIGREQTLIAEYAVIDVIPEVLDAEGTS